jgi:hypothetical protein
LIGGEIPRLTSLTLSLVMACIVWLPRGCIRHFSKSVSFRIPTKRYSDLDGANPNLRCVCHASAFPRCRLYGDGGTETPDKWTQWTQPPSTIERRHSRHYELLSTAVPYRQTTQRTKGLCCCCCCYTERSIEQRAK